MSGSLQKSSNSDRAAQAAVSLHLATSICSDIPVVLIDTGYLFAETYRLIDELTERLNLNLQVHRSPVSPASQEARYGERWQQGYVSIGDRHSTRPLQAPGKSEPTRFNGLKRE